MSRGAVLDGSSAAFLAIEEEQAVSRLSQSQKGCRVITWNRRSLGFAMSAILCVALGAALATSAPINESPAAKLIPSGAVVPHDATAGNAAAMPASLPDKFAWTLF